MFAPLCLVPLTARLWEQLGFESGYLSGGGLGYQLALSEALLTVDELAGYARAITRRSGLALVIDGGVGFGDPVHVARMMWEFEATGAVGVELEDLPIPVWIVRAILPLGYALMAMRFLQVLWQLVTGKSDSLHLADEVGDALKLKAKEEAA